MAHHERMRVLGVLPPGVTCLAHVKVLALGVAAPVATPRFDFALTNVAVPGECRLVGVVQVIERHHARVLGTPQRVKLEMVPLAQLQKRVASVKDVAVYRMVSVLESRDRLARLRR